MGDYAIRPPMGYTLKQAPIQQGEGRGMAYEWVGVSHADGNRPLLHIEIMFREGQWIPGATPNMEETAALQDVSGKDVSVVQSPIENGAVNGIPFARAYWHGIGSRTGKSIHGLVYTGLLPSGIIFLSAKDEEPDSRVTLPIFEASVLTFRKH